MIIDKWKIQFKKKILRDIEISYGHNQTFRNEFNFGTK